MAEPAQVADTDPLARIIGLISRGERGLRRLAKEIRHGSGDLWFLVSRAEIAEYLAVLEDELERERAAQDEGGDPERLAPWRPRYPKPVGKRLKDGGFMPCVFSSEERADAFASRHGLKSSAGHSPVMSRAWSAALVEFLDRRFAAVTIDDGTENRLRLSPAGMRHLYSELTIEDVARAPKLHVLTDGRRAHLQRSADDRAQVFAFTDERTAAIGISRLKERMPSATARAIDPDRLIAKARSIACSALVLDPLLPTERVFAAEDFERILRVRAGEQPEDITDAESTRFVEPPSAEPLDFEQSGVEVPLVPVEHIQAHPSALVEAPDISFWQRVGSVERTAAHTTQDISSDDVFGGDR